MSEEDKIRAEVLERWAVRFAVALPVTLDIGREFMRRCDVGGPKDAIKWMVVRSRGMLTEDQVFNAMVEITERVSSEIMTDLDLADPVELLEDTKELENMSKKFFDMGENINSSSPISTMSDNLWPADYIKKQKENLGLNRSREFMGEFPEPFRGEPYRKPEEFGGAGSEKVLLIHPDTIAKLNSYNPVDYPVNITSLYGVKVQVSTMVQEGQVFVISPTPLKVSEVNRLEFIRDRVSDIVNRFDTEPVVATAGTPFVAGDIMDTLSVGESADIVIIDDPVEEHMDSQKESEPEIAEERRRIGERRLRDDDKGK